VGEVPEGWTRRSYWPEYLYLDDHERFVLVLPHVIDLIDEEMFRTCAAAVGRNDAPALLFDLVVPCMTIPWQIAQKLHAVSAVLEEPKVNDRAHDLVDLQLLEGLLADTDLVATRSACIAVFEARAQHPWPPRVIALPHWPPIYVAALEGLDHLELAATVEEARQAVQRLVERIDRATRA
jgi:hypothetical protein